MSQIKHINCTEAVARLYDYLDREGPDVAIEEVEQHLDICRHCCDRFSFEATLWTVVRKRGTEARCPESLKIRVHSILTKYEISEQS